MATSRRGSTTTPTSTTAPTPTPTTTLPPREGWQGPRWQRASGSRRSCAAQGRRRRRGGAG
uniref:Uncharacterized protein n=1 Tax=Arundo donax TaxID=35708 RepID=A0A0A9GQS6_ARUDO